MPTGPVGLAASGDFFHASEVVNTAEVTSSVSTQDTGPQGLFWKPDGTKVYIAGSITDTIYEYTVTVPWDLSTRSASPAASKSVATEEGDVGGVHFSSDGTKMFIIGFANDTVYRYTLSTAWDVSSAGSTDQNSGALTTDEAIPRDLWFKPDGLKLYIIGSDGDEVNQYPLTVAWDLTTLGSVEATKSVSSAGNNPSGITFSPDGTRMFTISFGSQDLAQWNLSTAWDISTAGASADETKDFTSVDSVPGAVAFSDVGHKFYIVGDTGNNIYQFPAYPINGDQALSVSVPPQIINVGIASETDTAQLITIVRGVSAGLASETDTAQLITIAKSVSAGLASETDTAFNFTGVVLLAIESDTSFSIQPQRTYVLGQAVETDTAQTIIRQQINQAVETNTAQQIAAVSTVPVGIASEIDSAQSIVTLNKAFNADTNLPALSITSSLVIGNAYSASIQIPTLQIDAHAAWRVVTDIPALTVLADMVNGSDSLTNVRTPILTLLGTMSVPHPYTGVMDLPVVRLSGTLIRGSVMDGNMTIKLRRPVGDMDNAVQWDGGSLLALPSISAEGVLAVSSELEGLMVLPSTIMAGMLTNPSDVNIEGWVINSRILAHSKYQAFGYTSLGAFNSSIYGVNANGIFRLEGTNDDGTDIFAIFLSGFDDLGVENLKVQPFVYIGYKATGDLELLVGIDDNSTFSFAYPVDRDLGASELRPARITVGKGLRSRFWQLGMRNTLGADFTISSMELGAISTRRKS
jgi:hypothetical protein